MDVGYIVGLACLVMIWIGELIINWWMDVGPDGQRCPFWAGWVSPDPHAEEPGPGWTGW